MRESLFYGLLLVLIIWMVASMRTGGYTRPQKADRSEIVLINHPDELLSANTAVRDLYRQAVEHSKQYVLTEECKQLLMSGDFDVQQEAKFAILKPNPQVDMRDLTVEDLTWGTEVRDVR